MLLLKLWSYLMGYVSVTIEGLALEKFINLSLSRGIYLWDISRVGQNRFIAKVRLSGFRGLRHVGKRVDCKVKINSKAGAPFLLGRMKRRRMLLAGALLFVIAIYGLSSVVWFIEIEGTKTLAKSKILNDLAQLGLTQGAPKWRLDIDSLENHLLDENPRIAWAGIEIRGSKVIVEVRERKVVEEDPMAKAPADIVAAKRGLIKEVLVLNGAPVVKEGDTVEKGEVLISGSVYDPDLLEETAGSLAGLSPEEIRPFNKFVHAEGLVRARTWYQGYGEANIEEKGWRLTGKRIERYVIKIAGREIIVKGPRKLELERFNQDLTVKKVPQWRNINVPVEVIKATYHELGRFHLKRTPAEARDEAVRKAMLKCRATLSKGAKIADSQVVEVPGEDTNLVRVSVKIEAIEEIGEKRYLNKKN